MEQIYDFFISNYNVDLSDTKVYYISLVDRAGFYDTCEDIIVINSDYNSITRELTLIHELTHRMIAIISNISISDIDTEESYCKYVTLLYVEKVFGKEAVSLVKDLI